MKAYLVRLWHCSSAINSGSVANAWFRYVISTPPFSYKSNFITSILTKEGVFFFFLTEIAFNDYWTHIRLNDNGTNTPGVSQNAASLRPIVTFTINFFLLSLVQRNETNTVHRFRRLPTSIFLKTIGLFLVGHFFWPDLCHL